MSASRWGSLRVGVTLMVAIAVGCGSPAWSEAVRARYSLSSEEVRRVQFFTSGEIVLRREVGGQEKVVGNDGLQVRDDVRVEEIVIPAKTPCVALRVERDHILVSFSRRHPDQALWFGVKPGDSSLAPEARRFELVPLANALVESGPFNPEVSKGFLLTYGGKKYRLADGKGWTVHLLYQIDEQFEKDRTREEPDGWRVRDGVTPKVPSASAPSALPALPPPPSDGGAPEPSGAP